MRLALHHHNLTFGLLTSDKNSRAGSQLYQDVCHSPSLLQVWLSGYLL